MINGISMEYDWVWFVWVYEWMDEWMKDRDRSIEFFHIIFISIYNDEMTFPLITIHNIHKINGSIGFHESIEVSLCVQEMSPYHGLYLKIICWF